MALQQVWTDKKILAHGPLGIELASVSFFLNDELAGHLPDCLSLQVVARVFGVQIGAVTVSPLKDGDFSMQLVEPIGGTLKGRVDNLRPLAADGSPAPWNATVGLGFTVTALGSVTIPLSAIVQIVPVIGPLASAALKIFGDKLTVDLAHADIVVHLPRQISAAALAAARTPVGV